MSKKILVVGGSGRIGSSAIRAFYEKYGTNITVTACGKDSKDWKSPAKFVALDFDTDFLKLEKLIQQNDLIIHTAGPFQGITKPMIMESALSSGKKYLDVCDNIELGRICRSQKYQDLAKQTGGSALISAGIWPGASSLLSQKVIKDAGVKDAVKSIRFSFFTAGSGGAGPQLLAGTYMILGEKVLIYKNGQPEYRHSASDSLKLDFGDQIGERKVVRFNLIETEHCFQYSKIPYVESYFGTSPSSINTMLMIMARGFPNRLLRDRKLMSSFAYLSLRFVRIIDYFAGSKNGIRVDAITYEQKLHTGLLSHKDLEKCAGDAIVAFAKQMINDNVPVGVYYPEEVPGEIFATEILEDISKDSLTYKITSKDAHGYPSNDF